MSSIESTLKGVDRRTLYLLGRGGWTEFRRANMRMEWIYEAAEQWAAAFKGVERPWLVWNAHEDWCRVQQRLVEACGWTPVVGFDPRVGPPPLSGKAILVDFNKTLQLPFLHPVFVIEFLFLFTHRLAFWHSDLLIPVDKMQELAARFDQLKPGETMATDPFRPRLLRFWRKRKRFWELVGCSTREASRDQFERGAGWWSNIEAHVNCRSDAERRRRKKLVHWDHGAGIKYWHEEYGGPVLTIPVSEVDSGHFSPASHPKLYHRMPQPGGERDLKLQLDETAGVAAACRKVGIDLSDLMAVDGNR